MYPKLPEHNAAQWDELSLLFGLDNTVGDVLTVSGMTRRHRRISLRIQKWGEGIVGFRLIPYGADTQLLDWSHRQVCVGEETGLLTGKIVGHRIRVTGEGIPAIWLSMNPFLIGIGDTDTPIWSTSRPLGTIHEEPIGPLTAWYDDNPSQQPIAARLAVRLTADIHFSGMGERFFSTQLTGRTLQSWNEDADGVRTKAAYKTIPFVVSDRGWGLWFNSPGLSSWDLGDSTPLAMTVTTPTAAIEWCVIIGSTPKDIVERYVTLTGLPDSIPSWAAGIWLSTGSIPRTQDEIVALASEARSRGFPADVFFLDAHWQKAGSWGGAQWNTASIPRPQELLRTLRGMEYHLGVWGQPYIEEGAEAYVKAENEGLLLQAEDGSGPWRKNLWGDADPITRVGVLDFTHPQIRDWCARQYQEVLGDGVEIIKVDFGEEVPADAYTANHQRSSELHNIYALEYARTLYETVTRAHPEGMVLIRSGYSGVQRFPAVWPGDPHPTLDDLRLTVQGGLNAAASGIAYWTMDAGGYKEEPNTADFVRWAQAALFAPLARFHRYSRSMPWDYGEEAFAQIRELAELRYRLTPYIRALYHDSQITGCPVLRPLWIEFPEDPQSWMDWVEFMLGDAILVVPVTTSTGQVSFHLPPGRWLDWFSQDIVQGPRDIQRIEPLGTFPLFVRQGRFIPMFREVGRFSTELSRSVELLSVGSPAVGTRTVHGRPEEERTIRGQVEVMHEFSRGWMVQWEGRWPESRFVRVKYPDEEIRGRCERDPGVMVTGEDLVWQVSQATTWILPD
ncbi:MAG: hypothetical protein C7B45_06870 [Sulfobacillus acidophilus]|uniref:Uncharacterized protein n=1 Tax=Sulfobacillus acidophilus TaxID=53633 RepID=A0A2T2WJN7_9FIRM|nr:MAG: hypothetical protein C7B45_06870 [Sulfobacillus acidophilus]